MPIPLHADADITAGGKPEHVCAPHSVVASGYTQVVEVPSHVLAHTPVPGQAGRLPCGVPPIVVQMPAPTSHAWHCPVQGESQHTPSTQ